MENPLKKIQTKLLNAVCPILGLIRYMRPFWEGFKWFNVILFVLEATYIGSIMYQTTKNTLVLVYSEGTSKKQEKDQIIIGFNDDRSVDEKPWWRDRQLHVK